ncbi:MAG: DEAD/DEAH box helicase family protein [Erysipelotrichaceae bacterium]|nr:DEAD/DEAH box helicase family protein [Erysipelotrichaceae bacterium]
MINFGKLSAQLHKGKIINPTEIFMSLPEKNTKYAYLRNVQAEVLDQWFQQRDSKDNIIKMNTGSGKTTVALLILKSCLNEHGGHAAYVVPDNYLVDQVITEAKELGIHATTSEKDMNFITGESILIINIQKLFNGKSVFGMKISGNIQLDYILIDDVHACVDDVKDQFIIKVTRDSNIAKELFDLYKDDLKLQNEKAFLDICEGDSCSSSIMVPFWRIYETKSDLLAILQSHKDDKEIMFNYPLLGDLLEFCNCVFSYKGVEIEPYAIPIHKISSFCNATRRIFMSATLCDDSHLVSTFDINVDTRKAITPKQANDIGDRMILFPQAYSPFITDDDIKCKILEYSQRVNVVVIVPSDYRSKYWSDITENVFSAINIKKGIELIKSSSVGLYVLVNKYDGIDLPDNACRIIVLDGVPDSRTSVERMKENYLQGSMDTVRNKIQKIEQGMGRGVRSSNDYCGVIIMGAPLIQILYSPKSKDFFSNATKKQFEVSSILAQDLKEKSIDEIFDVLDYCITQNADWVTISKSALSDINYDKDLIIDQSQIVLRKAFNNAVLHNNLENSKQLICDEVNQTTDPIKKGYLMFEEAKYCQFRNPVEAQRILVSAQQFNHHVQKPIKGVSNYDYVKRIKPQAEKILDYFTNNDINSYIVELNAIVDSLVFAKSSYKKFENSMARLGELLGWKGMRITDGIGPDVLWYFGNSQYAVIECKNEATSETISKTYCEQLLSSVSWFKEKFESDFSCIPVIVHPSKVFDKYASPAGDFRVINNEKLFLLKTKLYDFCKAIATDGSFKDLQQLTKLLNDFSLTPEKFFLCYSVSFTKKQ